MAETVTVACKLPNGLLIQVGETQARLNGPARFLTPQPGRVNLNPIEDIVYSAGFTVVDKALWDAWIKDHKNFDPVKTGFVYAMPSRNEATAKAKDGESMKTGLEPIDILNRKGAVETADEMLKTLAGR
jgi:hypothetical protein